MDSLSSFDHLSGMARWWEEMGHHGRHHLSRRNHKTVASMTPWIDKYGRPARPLTRWLSLPGTELPSPPAPKYYVLNAVVRIPRQSPLGASIVMVAPPGGLTSVPAAILQKEADDDALLAEAENDDEPATWTPFNEDGTPRDLEAEGWHKIGFMSEDSIEYV